MTTAKKILHLEDSPEDAELIATLLEQGGLKAEVRWVTTRGAFQQALEEPWDLILADYSLPGIREMQALDLALERCPEVPFIYISGTLGESTAIECLHHGASDYVLKQGLGRLVPAVRRALSEGAERQARRKAEAGLVASEANYRRIVETSYEGIWVLDADARTTFANARMAEILGTSLEALQGTSLWEFVGATQRPSVEANLDKRRQGIADANEFCFRRKDGVDVWTLLATSPFFSEDGHYAGSMAMATDITELKAAQEARDCLAIEEQKLLAATRAVGVVPWSSDSLDGSVLMGSGSHIVLGWPPSHFRTPDFDLASLALPEDRLAFRQALAKAKAGETCTFDLRVVNADEQPLWTRWILSTNGGNLHGTVQDVSEPHSLLDMLLQSQKLESMGTVAGGVAHDVNNLLTVLFSHLDMIQEDGEVSPKLNRHLRAMTQASEQVKVLVGELLSFARKKEPRRTEVDLNELVSNGQDLFTAVLGRLVTLETALQPMLPFLLLDSGQIHQVLMNLIINARDAMPQGGEILLSTFATRDRVTIEIKDTGQGIPPEVVSRIFEPFFTTKPEGKGTGLGLAVVYGIVMAHGGTIQCTSKEGEGTRFQIAFPVAASS